MVKLIFILLFGVFFFIESIYCQCGPIIGNPFDSQEKGIVCFPQIAFGSSQTIVKDKYNTIEGAGFPSIVISLPFYLKKKFIDPKFNLDLIGQGYGVGDKFSTGFTNISTTNWFINLSTGISKPIEWGKVRVRPETSIGLAINLSGIISKIFNSGDSLDIYRFNKISGGDTTFSVFGIGNEINHLNPTLNFGLEFSRNISANHRLIIKPMAIVGLLNILEFNLIYSEPENNIINESAQLYSTGSFYGLSIGLKFIGDE